MKKVAVKKLSDRQIICGAKWMALSNLALLTNKKFASVDDVNHAWYQGGMDMMDSGLSESEIDKSLEDELKYWGLLLRKGDEYSVATIEKHLPFLFKEVK
jgi:hypothetical protein